MSRVRKFKAGRKIKTMAALSKVLDAGDWVFMWDAPKHNGWMVSMQYNALRNLVLHGNIRYALKTSKKPK